MKNLSLALAIVMILSVLTIGVGAADVAYDEIIAQAEEYGDSLYLFINEECYWEEAVQRCEELGGHLVTITSAGEEEFCYQLWKPSDTYGCWLGASDAETEGTWKWITGEEWDYTNWGSSYDYGDEPTDYADNGGEDYLNYWNHDFYNGGTWNDFPDWQTATFICEWDKDELKRDSVGADGDNSNISVPGEYVYNFPEDVVSVNISWEVPVFTFTAVYEWNPDTFAEELKDGSGTWSTDPATLTVANRSNMEIEAGFDFATVIVDSGIDGVFTSDAAGANEVTTITLENAAIAEAEISKTTYFFVTEGMLPKEHVTGDAIGNITITITAIENE